MTKKKKAMQTSKVYLPRQHKKSGTRGRQVLAIWFQQLLKTVPFLTVIFAAYALIYESSW